MERKGIELAKDTRQEHSSKLCGVHRLPLVRVTHGIVNAEIYDKGKDRWITYHNPLTKKTVVHYFCPKCNFAGFPGL